MASNAFSEWERLVDFVRANPGCSTAALAAADGVPYSASFYETMLRMGRSLGVGQDEHGAWWHYSDHPEIRIQFERGLPAYGWPSDDQ